MSPARSTVCANCKWWGGPLPLGNLLHGLGECRYRAPRRQRVSVNPWRHSGVTYVTAFFPMTAADDYCNDHAPADDAAVDGICGRSADA